MILSPAVPVTTTLETHKKNYFLPSATLGFNMLLRPTENKAHFISGLIQHCFLNNFYQKYVTTPRTVKPIHNFLLFPLGAGTADAESQCDGAF
jgi:hypothetical protein